jgi:hypothetical protein
MGWKVGIEFRVFVKLENSYSIAGDSSKVSSSQGIAKDYNTSKLDNKLIEISNELRIFNKR